MAERSPVAPQTSLPAESGKPQPSQIKAPTKLEVYGGRWPFYAFNVGSLVCGILGVGGFGLHPVDLVTKPVGWATLVFGCVGLVGLIKLAKQEPTVAQLRYDKAVADANLGTQEQRSARLAESAQVTFRAAMTALAVDLALGDEGRITLYRVPDTGPYLMAGRFAAHGDYDVVRKVDYMRGTGCIHSALETTHLVCLEIHADPEASREQWLAEQVASGISRETAEALRMKSRCYASLQLRDKNRAVGVVVCESTRKGHFSDGAATEQAIRRHASAITAFAVEAQTHGDYVNAWQRGY